jgi:hypothetical protein
MQPTEPPPASGSGQPPSPPAPAPAVPVPPVAEQGGPAAAPPPAGYPPVAQPHPGYPPQYGYPQQPKKPLLPVNLGDALTAFGGLLIFFFSFAPFVTYADSDLSNDLARSNLPTWFSAWSPETFMAPLTWFVALGGLIVAAVAAARLAVPRDREYAGFRTGHVQIGLGLFLFVTLFGYATSAKSAIFGHDFAVQFTGVTQTGSLAMHFGWGGYVMLLGGLAAAVGAVLSHLEIGPIVYPQPPKPPAAYPPPGYGAPQYPPAGQYAEYAQSTAGYPPAAPVPSAPPAAPPPPAPQPEVAPQPAQPAQPAPQPASTQPAPPEPAAPEPAAPEQPTQVQPAQVQPAQVQPAQVQPEDGQPEDGQPEDGQPKQQ